MARNNPHALLWSEWTEPKTVYPNGIHGKIAEFLSEQGFTTTLADMQEKEQGLDEKRLQKADVLFWFGHKKHDDVKDEYVHRVVWHVTEEGMGFIPLHSSHLCRPFRKLMGTACTFPTWLETAGEERIEVLAPDHPIAEGVEDFSLPQTEMYGEPFDVPEPGSVVFHSRWKTGEEFRSGCCWTCGKGKIFYFRPGHETYPIFMNRTVQRILTNAAHWAVKEK